MKKLVCNWCKKSFENKRNRKFCSISCSTSSRNSVDEPDFIGDNEVSDEFKAYFAGLVWADGCYSNNNGLDRLTLSMNEEDLMFRIAEIVSPNRKIYIQKPRKDSHNIGYSVITRNKNVLDQFCDWGITYRKSKTIGFPTDFNLDINHFIRGVFDGDGCIYVSSQIKGKKYYAVSFTSGSDNMTRDIINFLQENSIKTTLSQDKRHFAHYVKIYTKEDLIRLKELMYQDATWFLDRKKIKFDDIV